MYAPLLHAHTLLVSLFLLSALIKSGLMVSGNYNTLRIYRNRFMIPEIIVSVGFLVTGIWMTFMSGFSEMPGWFYLKLAIIVIAVPLGIVGFKREDPLLASISTLLFIYIILLAFLKTVFLVA